MNRSAPAKRLIPAGLAAALAVGLIVAATHRPAIAAPPVAAAKVVLAPHRAVYDLKLAKTHGGRPLQAVTGRILYDFSGNACDGYQLQFRQVSELDSGEGAPALTDLRSTTWEDAAAKKFRFNSENVTDDKKGDTVEGSAERNAGAVAVDLKKPASKKITLPVDVVFPSEHMRRIIIAAREGQSILDFPVYDGSEGGDKFSNTLTVIGKPILPGEKPPTDATTKMPALARLTRWPVTISYFDQALPGADQAGEQTPAYSIGFELYENGVSRALTLAYADFTIAGEMTSLEAKKDNKLCQ